MRPVRLRLSRRTGRTEGSPTGARFRAGGVGISDDRCTTVAGRGGRSARNADHPRRAAARGPGADGTPLNDYWRNGLRFESADKRFSVFVGGRVQFDAVNYLTTTAIRGNIPGTTVLEDGVSFRRVRIDVGGTIYTNIDFYAQVDFANGFLAVPNSTAVTNATYPTDLWVQFKDLPVVGNVRVGNQKPLYSFEHLTSSRFLTFLERSLGFDAFAEGQNNGFEPGITVSDTYSDKRGTWARGCSSTPAARSGGTSGATRPR